MLVHLSIQNYVIVDELELDIKPGLTAITGETGAGKSIMLDALSLALGDRATADCVLGNAKQAQISAQFDITNITEAQNWLEAHDLDFTECILRRVINSDGRSRGYINGTACTLNDLQNLGELLLDLHSQHEHQSLLKPNTHQKLLDEFANAQDLTNQVKDLAKKWQQTYQELENIKQNENTNTKRINFLQFELEELEQLNLQQGEIEQLEQEAKQLNFANDLIDICRQINEIAEQQLNPALNQINRNLNKAKNMTDALDETINLFETAQIQSDEALKIVVNFLDDFTADPERLQQIEARLALIYQLARKHSVNPEQLLEVTKQLKQELFHLEQSSTNLTQLEADLTKLEQKYRFIAQKLSIKRAEFAQKLSEQVSLSMDKLGMKHGIFQVVLTPNNNNLPNINGLESVEFLVATNPNQAPKPLIKVASGGELSRISLAIAVITAQTSRISTLIFDEVDVGIGGPTAEIVGKMLRTLGKNGQVITVTHLAQVAACAHQHLRASKTFVNGKTHIDIDELDTETRIHEIARMLGGVEITQESIAHATTFIKRNQL